MSKTKTKTQLRNSTMTRRTGVRAGGFGTGTRSTAGTTSSKPNLL